MLPGLPGSQKRKMGCISVKCRRGYGFFFTPGYAYSGPQAAVAGLRPGGLAIVGRDPRYVPVARAKTTYPSSYPFFFIYLGSGIRIFSGASPAGTPAGTTLIHGADVSWVALGR